LLQETAQRAGVSLPVYTTVRSGPGHLPVFTCDVEVAGMVFPGEAAKTKKQAEKNAAMAAWSALKQCKSSKLLCSGSCVCLGLVCATDSLCSLPDTDLVVAGYMCQ
jgi:hypothetical protein